MPDNQSQPAAKKHSHHGHHRSHHGGHHSVSSAPPSHQMGHHGGGGGHRHQPKKIGGSVAVRGPQEPTSLEPHHHLKRPQQKDYVEGHGTPTPSEKVSRWHRDIYMMSPNGTVTTNHSAIAALAAATHGAIRGPHPAPGGPATGQEI